MGTLRRQGPVVLGVVAIVVGAAAAYAFLTPNRYEAQAELLVTPAQGKEELRGLGLLEDGQSPAAVTAAQLVETPAIARTVAIRLRMKAEAARDAVDAKRVERSNVVRITTHSSKRARSAQIANAFAEETVSALSARFQSDLQFRIQRLRARLEGLPIASPRAVTIREQVDQLTALQGAPDPTVRVVSTAVAPTEPSWPDRRPIVIGALLAALALGLAIAAVREALQHRRVAAAAAPAVWAQEVASLEQRLVERLDRLGRDVRGASEFTHTAEEELLAARDHALEEREQTVEEQDRALRARKRQLDERERTLAERHADLEERERRLDERVTALTTREVKLARRNAELDHRERELEAGAAATKRETERAPEPEPEPQRRPEPVPVFAPAPEPVAEAAGRELDGVYHLERLEALVATRESDFPERVNEWRAYLYFLREHAAPDGTLPSNFAYLIEETFAEVLE